MFWEKSYSQSQNIENLLQKEDVTVEELLDDEDILQECKLQTRRLIQFLTRPDVIKRLITLTITEPPENLSVAERFKYSNTACEILTFGLPSLDEKIVEDTEILQTLYSFLENEPPLNPLLAAFFSKTFSMLISKKSEQDWFLYQKMCLQLLEFIKSRENFLDLIFKHFATPVIMDLLLQIIKEVQGGALKKNLYEWLTEQKLVERVINILGNPKESEKHANVAEFVIDLIKHGRSMRQLDQEDKFESAFTGTDPLLQTLEDETTITQLLNVMLNDNPQESSIVAGIQIVLTLVDESIVDEPASDKALKKMIDKEKDNHERVVSTVIQTITLRVQDFHRLLLEPPIKNDITIARPNPVFGLTRLEICRLFTVLLETGNSKMINEICEADYFNTLLKLFKQYSWNNFLHSEVEKCLRYVFTINDQNENNENNQNGGIETGPSALQKYVIINCKIIPKLVECWLHNTEAQSIENGRRQGYMGHLIQILENIIRCISNSDDIGALIESNLDEIDLANWKSLIDTETGELTIEMQKQSKLLADCDPKGFQHDGIIADHDNGEINYSDGLEFTDLMNDRAMSKFCEIISRENFVSSICEEIASDIRNLNLNLWRNNMDDNLDDDMDLDRYGMDSSSKLKTDSLNMPINPWGSDPFGVSATGSMVAAAAASAATAGDTSSGSNDISTSGWADFSSNNFADFESHFNSYANDFGDKFDSSQDDNREEDEQQQQQRANLHPIRNSPELEETNTTINEANVEIVDDPVCKIDDQTTTTTTETGIKMLIEKSDNNANVEKIPIDSIMLMDQNELDVKNAKNLDLQNVENQNDVTITTTTTETTATGGGGVGGVGGEDNNKSDCNELFKATAVAQQQQIEVEKEENKLVNSHEKLSEEEARNDVDMETKEEEEKNEKDEKKESAVVLNGPNAIEAVVSSDTSNEKEQVPSINDTTLPTNDSTNSESSLAASSNNKIEKIITSAITPEATIPPSTASSLSSLPISTSESTTTIANNKTSNVLENGPI